jgi:hypothetical protein
MCSLFYIIYLPPHSTCFQFLHFLLLRFFSFLFSSCPSWHTFFLILVYNSN